MSRRLMLIGVLSIACISCIDQRTARRAIEGIQGSGVKPDEMPVMLNNEPPFRYPTALYDRRVQGNVTLRIHVDSAGTVIPDSTTVVESSGYSGLDSAAVLGSRDLHFSPARLHGRPMPVSILLPVFFRHPEAKPLPGDTILKGENRAGTGGKQKAEGRKRIYAPSSPRQFTASCFLTLTYQHMADHERNRLPYDDVLQTIGWTPLIRLNRVTRGIATPVYGKADFFNPGGSVKDRIGLPIIEQAEREGRLQPGGTIVEGTSGNTGVGLAIAAALKGYRCVFTMPDKMSQEKVRLLKAFGAQVIVTPTAVPPDHPDNYVMTAQRIANETPNAILANQFYNQANPAAHYATTGPEIWEQTQGRITHFVAAAGTGGTITGVGRFLKEKNPNIKVISGDPVGSILANYWQSGEKIEGVPYKVEGIGQDKLPGTLDMKLIDDYRTVSDRDAFAMARRLTREEGLFVGGSSGLIAHVALEVAREVNDPEALVVTFLCDTGERYLSKLYSDEWMRENQLLEPDRVSIADLADIKPRSAPAIVGTTPGATVRQALRLMSLHDVSQLPVMDGDDCIGSVSESVVSAKAIEDTKMLDATVSDVMDAPFPVVDGSQQLDSVVKLLNKANPAVLLRQNGRIVAIVTRSDVLHFMMAR